MTESMPDIDFMERLRARQPYEREEAVPARRRDGDEHFPGREPALPIRRRDGDEEPPRPPHPVAPEMSRYSFSDVYTWAARHYANAFLSDVGVQEQPDRRRARYDHANLAQLQILQDEKSTFQTTLETRLDAPGMETKYTSHAPTTKWQAALEGLKFWKPYIYNTQDKEETRRGIQEVREAYRALNTPQGLAAASAEAGERTYTCAYLAPQEVGEIVDQIHSKAARAAVRQLAIDAGYVAPLDNLDRFGNYEAQIHLANFTLIKPWDNRMGQREGEGVETTWNYNDSYNFKRAVKLGEMGRAALRQGAIVGIAALSGGTSAAASTLASVIALPALAAPIGHAINTNIADYVDNVESARSVSAIATTGLLTAGSLGVQYVTGVDLSSFVPYLAGMTGLVAASEFCHTRSRRTESQTVRGNWTLTSAIFDYLILPFSYVAKPGQFKSSDSAPNESPTIQNFKPDMTAKVGQPVNYSFDISDKPLFGDGIQEVKVEVTHPNGTVDKETLYANGLENIQRILGDSNLTENGQFTADQAGKYKVHVLASDQQGLSSSKTFTFNISDHEITSPTTEPETVEPGTSDAGSPGSISPGDSQPHPAQTSLTKEYSEADIRRIYLDEGKITKADMIGPKEDWYEHGASREYVLEATDQNYRTFTVDTHHANGQYAYVEGYLKDDFDHDGTLETRLISGKILGKVADLPNHSINLNNLTLTDSAGTTYSIDQMSGYQVGLVNAEFKEGHLCIEFTSSESIGDYSKGDYLVEKEEACHQEVQKVKHTAAPQHDIVAKVHSFDLSINEIPKNPSEQLVFTASDTFGDGMRYVVDIHDQQGNLVEHTIYQDAPGAFVARNRGIIPQLTVPGTYSVEMSGHDLPNIVQDSEPRFIWTVEPEAAHVIPNFSPVQTFDFTGTSDPAIPVGVQEPVPQSTSPPIITEESGFDLTLNSNSSNSISAQEEVMEQLLRQQEIDAARIREILEQEAYLRAA